MPRYPRVFGSPAAKAQARAAFIAKGGGTVTPTPTPSVFANGVWDDTAAWNDSDAWKDAA